MGADRRWFHALIAALLPIVTMSADVPASAARSERLEWLVTAHDVRHAIEMQQKTTSDCNQHDTERT